jgi:hypothetical protein
MTLKNKVDWETEEITPFAMLPKDFVDKIEMIESWSYDQSTKGFSGFYASWKNVTDETLAELLRGKEAILSGKGSRYGRPLDGETTWAGYIEDCFEGEVTQRTVDGWLAAYVSNDYHKPDRLTKAPPQKVIITGQDIARYLNIKKTIEGNVITLSIYCPKSGHSYTASVAL